MRSKNRHKKNRKLIKQSKRGGNPAVHRRHQVAAARLAVPRLHPVPVQHPVAHQTTTKRRKGSESTAATKRESPKRLRKRGSIKNKINVQ